MELKTWFIFLAISILPVISPGPAILLAVSNALRFGPRATLYSATGNMFGLIFVGFAVAFGLAAIMAASAVAFTALKFAGAIYLIYLGVKLWRDKQAFVPLTGPAPLVKTPQKLFGEAFLIAITNPKAIIILAALIPPFVNPSAPAVPQVAIMSITYAGMCFLNHLVLAFAGGWMRRMFASERRMRNLRRTLGAMFIGFGAALATASR